MKNLVLVSAIFFTFFIFSSYGCKSAAANKDGNTLNEGAVYKTERQKEYETINDFIINSLKNKNITIDNLLKLSNIRLKANENEIMRALSILEINSEIERLPGRIIKKI